MIAILISEIKLSISELATGNKKVEKWTFLPRNWIHRLDVKHDFLFEMNFVVLNFDVRRNPHNDPGDLLILNLATRKKFWMQRLMIENQIKAKVTNVDDDGNPYDFDDFWVEESMIHEMKIGINEIGVKYKIEYQTDDAEIILGSFKLYLIKLN